MRRWDRRISEISVKRFAKGRATLEMNLREPVELLRELENARRSSSRCATPAGTAWSSTSTANSRHTSGAFRAPGFQSGWRPPDAASVTGSLTPETGGGLDKLGRRLRAWGCSSVGSSASLAEEVAGSVPPAPPRPAPRPRSAPRVPTPTRPPETLARLIADVMPPLYRAPRHRRQDRSSPHQRHRRAIEDNIFLVADDAPVDPTTMNGNTPALMPRG